MSEGILAEETVSAAADSFAEFRTRSRDLQLEQAELQTVAARRAVKVEALDYVLKLKSANWNGMSSGPIRTVEELIKDAKIVEAYLDGQ